MVDYEKLGVFYLGKEYDLDAGKRTDSLVLYDSKDLVTHAVCVGMTGSGKTGLCIGLLEEAAIDGIPALIIDPKGDLANLLLTFPKLNPEDFRPWINESDAQTKGLSPDDFAKGQAELWRKGLTDWNQPIERIQKLRDAADVTIYTPGSNAGVPVSILRSFSCPPQAILDDAEALSERVSTAASGLLGLVGVDADPVKSKEHILLANILHRAWNEGEDLDLGGIIQRVQQPPFTRVGVLDVEGFYPSKDRFELAMRINNLLASPGFAQWMEGEALDIGTMLYTPQGKPRLAILSVAHLNDAERMFFVSTALNEMLAWTRAQSGTTSLRAILYMDEIAGYFPPIANPPSKRPLLTLMKQARAFGVGVVVATQNPVDIDYKGLSNAGTWFVGRLQTEQDKTRLLDGLAGAMQTASRNFDRAEMDRTLSRLGKRVFLLHNVHEDGPVVMETRFVMSYLRGPLTRQQIRTLTQSSPTAPAPAPTPPARNFASPPDSQASANAPVLPPEVPQYFVPVRGSAPQGASLVYTPMILGFAKVRFTDTKLKIDSESGFARMAQVTDGPVAVNFEQALAVELSEADVEKSPAAAARFDPLAPACAKAKSYDAWAKDFADCLFRTATLETLSCPALALHSSPGEDEKSFRLRASQLAREDRDLGIEKLRLKYASKMTTLQERIRKSEQKIEVQKSQATSAKVNTALSVGASILGAVFGRKLGSSGNVGRATTAMRGMSRSMQESGDVDRAKEDLSAAQSQLAELEAQMQSDIDALTARSQAAEMQLTTTTLRPKRTNINVRAVVLAWVPHWRDPNGASTSAWA